MSKKPGPLIDPAKIQADMLAMIIECAPSNAAAGLTVDEIVYLFGKPENYPAYATYPEDHIREWVVSRLENLKQEGLIELKGDHYFPTEEASVTS